MEMEATAGSFPAEQSSALRRIGMPLAAMAVRVVLTSVVASVVISLVLIAWAVRRGDLYTSASDVGYWLGVAGGSLMVVLLIYPLRKRFKALAVLGPLKHWFRFHIVAGIAGPLIVLFHSTFHVGSFNAAIALACMLLVVASGLVGRFIYRKIHHGLYGSRATAADLQRSLEKQVASLHRALFRLPAIERELGRFSALVSLQPQGCWQRGLHFASLGWKRYLAARRVRRAIAGCGTKVGPGDTATTAHLHALAQTIDDTLRAIQRTAQFSTYEKLFSLWHVVHIPFLFLLVVTAIVHVVAVHAY
ncbi:MAG: hypothetical protein D4R84_12750 [Rhodocyclaceae bacterium]|nr:MAG: hypothetical protein D4R84_12750 [Rhodocyclaceae bacterium]